MGQTLYTTQAEIYRAIIESTAFGARAIIERIREYGVPVERIERHADHMLKQVSATPEQQAKIHAIIEAAAKDIDPIRKTMTGTRAAMRTLLTAPQIDRTAIETLRAQRIAGMDQVSQRMTKALADAADVLTPDQRQKLATIEAKHDADHRAKHEMHEKN